MKIYNAHIVKHLTWIGGTDVCTSHMFIQFNEPYLLSLNVTLNYIFITKFIIISYY